MDARLSGIPSTQNIAHQGEPPPYGPLRAAGQEGAYSVLGAAQTPLLRRSGRAEGPPSARVPPSSSSEAFSHAPGGREQASPSRSLPTGRPRGPCSSNCTADIHQVCGQKVGKVQPPTAGPLASRCLWLWCPMAAKPFCLLVTPWPSLPSLPFCDQLALLAVLDFANSGASGSPPGPASWPLSCPGLCQQPWKLSITPVV